MAVRRVHIFIFGVALLFAPSAQSATCTGCGVLAGVSLKQNITPDYILIIGDPQIGASCVGAGRWSTIFDDAAHQLCGAAQVNETQWTITDAFSRYPIGLGIIEGDLVDTTGDWQVTALQTMISSLPANIRSKLKWVGGNHDGNSTNCSKLPRYLSTRFDTAGGVSPIVWSARLNQTRLLGIQSVLLTMDTSTACQAQDNIAKHVTGNAYAAPVCYGDEAAAVGITLNLVACAADSECKSGTCGIWEDEYEKHFAFLEKEFEEFNNTTRDKVLVLNMHQALCRTGDPNCGNDPATTNDVFDRTQNLLQCDALDTTDVGKYCDIVNAAHQCSLGNSHCVDQRTGFEARDRLLALVENIPTSKEGFVQATGHVGGSPQTPTVDNSVLTSGLGFLTAEAIGSFTNGWTTEHMWGMVVKVEYNAPPTIVEYLRGPNNAPVLNEIGTGGEIAIASSGTGSFVITATDIDFGNLDYYINTSVTPGLDACLSLDQKSTLDAGDITAGMIASGCVAGVRLPPTGEYTLCVTDGLLNVGLSGPDPVSTASQENCSLFHIQVAL